MAGESDFVYYHYNPSLAAATIFIILFGLSLSAHIFQMFTKKTWYFIPFVIGCATEISEFLSKDDFLRRYHRYSSSLTFALAYGMRIPTGQEEEVKGVELIINHLNEAFITNWIVDSLPFLNKLPDFLKPWKKIADVLGDEKRQLFNEIWEPASKRKGYNWC